MYLSQDFYSWPAILLQKYVLIGDKIIFIHIPLAVWSSEQIIDSLKSLTDI